MDPLSLTAAAIGIANSVTIVNQTFRLISSLKNAPTEFLDLQNELETIRGYLDVLRSILTSLDAALSPAPAVVAHIERTLGTLEDDVGALRAFSDTFLRSETGKVCRVRWRRRREVIAAHRDKIQRRRLELVHAVGLLQPVQSQNHGALLLGIHHWTNKRFAYLEDLIEASESRLQTSIGSLDRDRCPTAERFHRLGDGGGVGGDATAKPASSALSQAQAGGQHFDVLVSVRHRCRRGCPCQCHRRGTAQTPGGFLSRMLGQVFLNYSSVPVWDPRPCDAPGCRNTEQRSDSAMLHYVFPSWLMPRLVALSASWGSLTGQGASLHVRVRRVLPSSHPVWLAIVQRDVDRVRSLIESREVIPADVNPNGMSIFFYSLADSDNAPLRRYLLPLVGRGQINNRESNFAGTKSPWSFAKLITRTLRRHFDAEVLASYQQILDLGDDEDEAEGGSTAAFPIHDAVCARGAPDNRPLSTVQDALRDNPRAVNVLDSTQMSPMHLAAILDDVDVLGLLLAWGADPDITGQEGITPLLSAMTTPAPRAARFLIENGADVNRRSRAGRSCLDYSISRTDVPVELTGLLISHGAALVRTSPTTNPLHDLRSCFVDPEEAAATTQKLRLLLDAGLHVDAPNGAGASPLLTSVEWDGAGSVKALLQHGASAEFVAPDGRGLLHYAAQYARKDTMGVLMAYPDIRGLDLELRSSEGMTAAEYFERRLNPPEDAKSMVTPVDDEDAEAWRSLLDMVRSGSYEDFDD